MKSLFGTNIGNSHFKDILQISKKQPSPVATKAKHTTANCVYEDGNMTNLNVSNYLAITLLDHLKKPISTYVLNRT